MILTAKYTKYANTAAERVGRRPTASPGFTRLELLVVAGALALLACVALPGLAGTRPRTDRAVCANNLRQIGQAFNLWANDYNDQKPCWVPFNSGGLSPVGHAGPLPTYAGQVGNVWFHYAWLANELRTPKMLVCPADMGRNVKVAQDFSGSPESGFVNPNFRDRAVSYFVSLHAYPGHATAWVGGDSHVSGYTGGTCSTLSGLPHNPLTILLAAPAVWSGPVHEGAGNILLNDGRVQLSASADLVGLQTDPLRAGTASLHLLVPAR